MGNSRLLTARQTAREINGPPTTPPPSPVGGRSLCSICTSMPITWTTAQRQRVMLMFSWKPSAGTTRSSSMTNTVTKPNPIGRSRLPELLFYFLRLSLLGFGGPVALVSQMEREVVAERAWLSKEQMREAIAICQSMPGPLAIQVGIYIAYLRGGF